LNINLDINISRLQKNSIILANFEENA
jgi:hypothetical protein